MSHTSSSRWFAAAALVVTALVCNVAAADDTTWDLSAYKDWTVADVVIEGLGDDMANELKDGLALALKTGFLGLGRPIFFPQTLESDLNRTRLFLARRGYPHARVDVRFEPDNKDQKVVVILEVDSGPPVLIKSVAISGFPSTLLKDADNASVAKPGKVFADGDIEMSVASLTLLLLENGHANAMIKSNVEPLDSVHVEVVFEATPGPVFYFGDVIVEGADDDVVPLVVKSISAKNGTRYSPDRLDDSEKNLRVLGLFRQIRLELSEVADDTLDVVAQLTMREPRRLEAGVRYWSEEKLDGGARWTHRNLFKRGRGGAVTISASSVRQRFDVSAWWPAILVARSRLSTTVGINRETEESYTQLDTGGDVTLSYNFGLRSRILFGLLLSNVDVIEATDAAITDIEQDGFLAAWSFVVEEDRGNDPIVPTRGTYTRVRAEWAPKYEFTDYHYIKIEPTVSAYVGVPRTKTTVFAVRLTLGGADPLGESVDLLPSKRFYSGGATSMRGFQRRKLGPLDSGGAPIGGEALLESSAELRFPMFWRLRGAVFADAGQVWPTIDDVTTDNIEVAVGVGLWFTTAIGPIRVDYGYRLTDYEKSQKRYAYHFSIGPAF